MPSSEAWSARKLRPKDAKKHCAHLGRNSATPSTANAHIADCFFPLLYRESMVEYLCSARDAAEARFVKADGWLGCRPTS